MSDSTYYIGRTVDLNVAKQDPATMETVRYDPDDLTTHGIIVGMTGSGKTGLLVGMLEEAAMSGLPAIVIDPKGDLTNLLLHFPDLLPADFAPWIDPETARRENISMEQLSEITANRWREGLKNWDLDRDELLALKQAADYVVYTPGSSSGQPVNLLSSFAPPHGLNWAEHREILRERISATVTALLGLVGLRDIDPLRSREHILLCNILENAWSKAQALDLTELILQVQNPPFERMGAFPVNAFFPQNERFDLALLLNNFLASPSFQAWVEGQPIEVQDFLYTAQGRPRVSIFYLAHLDDNERMFFVTLLLASVESWMRAQRGSTGLRALLAFDEIVGYLPPVANPPSRPVLLRLLKQARAFGLGLLLATQNPVDLDYKSLSNAGTWFIGRLQTDQDKQRLLDGLQSLEGGVDRGTYDNLISTLRPRVFLLHNVHNRGGAFTFQPRWCLNYLAGPLSRAQLSALKPLGSGPEVPAQPGGVYAQPAATAVAPPPPPITPAQQPAPQAQPAYAAPALSTAPAPFAAAEGATRTPPPPPAGVVAHFLSPELSLSQALAKLGGSYSGPLRPEGMLYRPALFYQAEVAYANRTYNLNHTRQVAALVTNVQSARPAWDEAMHEPVDRNRLDAQPLPDARFYPLPGWLSAAGKLSAYEKDFVDWVYRAGELRLFANTALKLYGDPEDSQASFRQKCDAAARDALESDSAKIEKAYRAKIDALERKIERQKERIDKNESEVSQRNFETLSSGAELIIGGIFGKRKRSVSTTLSKNRMAQDAKADLQTARRELESMTEQLNNLKKQLDSEIEQVKERWARAVGDIDEISVTPYKKDIYLEVSGLVWLPVYLVNAEGRTFEAPAY